MLRKLYKYGLIISILLCSLPTMAQQRRTLTRDNDGQRRLALIIGNGNYVNARRLVNPPNDAADMTATLTELGFEVISGTNLNLKQMTEKVREFGDKLKTSGGVGLFYYAGHGVQVSGRNYLIPVEADIPREDEIGFVALDLNQVLQKMATANNGLNIVVLDACRNNPFARGWSRDASDDGLAQITAPKGTFIAYATSPDMTASDGTGRNGLYTAELLKYLKQPNLKIEETFKEVTKAVDDKSGGRQTPWFSSSLRGEFIFKPNQKTASVTKPIQGKNSSSSNSSLPGNLGVIEKSKVVATPNSNESSQITLPESAVNSTSNAINIKVNADDTANGWTNSGFVVKKGQKIKILATGKISLGGHFYSTPAGNNLIVDKQKIIQLQPTGGLVGVIGDNNNDFIFLGDSSEFVAQRDGVLFLGVNEGNLSDNSGSYDVKIEVSMQAVTKPINVFSPTLENPFNLQPIEALFNGKSPYLSEVRSAVVSGNLAEIKDKRKVYVSAYSVKGVLASGAMDSSSKKMIVDKLTKYGGVEIVENPETADFIIHYSGEGKTYPGFSEKIDGNMIVVVREPAASSGSVKARVLWKDNESQTYDGGYGLISLMKRHPADSMTRHFIEALKKVRGEK